MKFSKSLTNDDLLSRLVTKSGSFNEHLLNINLTHRIVELKHYEFWALNEENPGMQKRGRKKKRNAKEENLVLSYILCNSEIQYVNFLSPPILVFLSPSHSPVPSIHRFPCVPQFSLRPNLYSKTISPFKVS